MRFDRGANLRFHFACVPMNKPVLLEARQRCRDFFRVRKLTTL
jgi:hypothetical protein